ncbi:hypothetical protein VAWG005_16170 [Aeromonas dhakensis]|nr:hypothetical protein VAWG003_16130 [Aeromonas dhakensis]BEE25689.1 hypothetical protein VAWG005_16170 [Aeromonas dhakensis]
MLGRAGLPEEQAVTLTFPARPSWRITQQSKSKGRVRARGTARLGAMFSNMTQAAMSRVGRDWQCGVICLSG